MQKWVYCVIMPLQLNLTRNYKCNENLKINCGSRENIGYRKGKQNNKLEHVYKKRRETKRKI